jgi:hypothetical protein
MRLWVAMLIWLLRSSTVPRLMWAHSLAGIVEGMVRLGELSLCPLLASLPPSGS